MKTIKNILAALAVPLIGLVLMATYSDGNLIIQPPNQLVLGTGSSTANDVYLKNSSAALAIVNNGNTITTPAFGGTVALGTLTNCAASASCASPTTQAAAFKFVTGTIAFSAATTAALTGMPSFTSATSYTCTASNPTHNYTAGGTPVSATAFTFVSGTSNSDTWQYVCIGY